MSDTIDDMNAMRKASQERRAFNRTESARRLTEAGIPFTSHNDGAHLIVATEWAFWPGTGRWCHRGPPHAKGRGVRNLISRIKP